MRQAKDHHEALHNGSPSAGCTAETAGSWLNRLPASMRPEEYATLSELLAELNPSRPLEIGMANGESTGLICRFLRDHGGGRHVAIDPFQTSPEGWNGQGLRLVRDSGLGDYLEFIEDYDYLALPRLLEARRRFDFILIDGWHSFDYTLLDLFFADLLLDVGGVVVVHDTGWPAVYKAVRFFETHKPYELVGPPPAVHLKSLYRKMLRRLGQLLSGPRAVAEARSRRERWCSLAAYRKRRDHQVPLDYYRSF